MLGRTVDASTWRWLGWPPLHHPSNNWGFCGKFKYLNGFYSDDEFSYWKIINKELVAVCFIVLKSITMPTPPSIDIMCFCRSWHFQMFFCGGFYSQEYGNRSLFRRPWNSMVVQLVTLTLRLRLWMLCETTYFRQLNQRYDIRIVMAYHISWAEATVSNYYVPHTGEHILTNVVLLASELWWQPCTYSSRMDELQ